MTTLNLDEIDVRLLDELQADAGRTLRELGDLIGLSPSAVQRRVKRYEAAGLTRIVAKVDSERAGGLTRALVLLTLAEESLEHHRRLAETLRDHPAVQQCNVLAGRWDYAVVVTAATVSELRNVSTELFKKDGNIRRYDTLFMLDTVKDGTVIPAELLR